MGADDELAVSPDMTYSESPVASRAWDLSE
jgi:hypothetical protein